MIKDDFRNKHITLSNKETVTIVPDETSPFWFIRFDQIPTPPPLDSAWTDYRTAYLALCGYIEKIGVSVLSNPYDNIDN